MNRKKRKQEIVTGCGIDGIETLDSDLMDFRKRHVSQRTEIGLKSTSVKGEEREERLKGV